MDGRKRREKLETLVREREISRHPPPPPHTQVTRVASLSCQSVFEAQISTRLSHCGPPTPILRVCVAAGACVDVLHRAAAGSAVRANHSRRYSAWRPPRTSCRTWLRARCSRLRWKYFSGSSVCGRHRPVTWGFPLQGMTEALFLTPLRMRRKTTNSPHHLRV